MSVTIVLKNSQTPNDKPTTSDLVLGELAINTYDAKVFFKQTTALTSSIVELATISGSGGSVVSASHADYADTAGSAAFATTAGSAQTAISSSYSVTSSFALNAGAGDSIVAGAITAQVTTSPSSIFLIKSGSGTLLNMDSTGNIYTNGSITVETTGSLSSFMLIKNNGTEYVKVNNEGVLVLRQYATPPTAVSGGFYFDTVGNLFVGL